MTFEYRAKPWIMILVVIFFGGCGAILLNLARTNDVGLILNGLIRFNTQNATLFYYALTVCSAAFVLIGLMGLYNSFRKPKLIDVALDHIRAPRSVMSKTYVTVPYADIIDMGVTKVQNQQFLTILHAGGKLNIAKTGMKKGAFDAMVTAVQERMKP